MSLWSKLRGTIESIFQIGLAGPQLKNNAGVIEARNSADAAFAVVRGATAVASNDLVTFAQLPAAGLIAPVTATTRTNAANATYTIDTTGGGSDYAILHNHAGATSYVLPAQSGAGRVLVLRDVTGAIGTLANNVFVVPHSSDLLNGSAGLVLSGGATFNFTNGSPTVTATGSKFQSELAVGMSIASSNQAGVNYLVSAIGSDTSLTIAVNFSGTTTTTATGTRTSLTYAANFGTLNFLGDGTNWTIKGDGTPTVVSYTASSGGTVPAMVFPPGVTSATARGCGGGAGGSGGNGAATGATISASSGPGGGGALEAVQSITPTPNTAYAVVVGAGGTGGTGTGNNTAGNAGGPGTSTTLGATLATFGGASPGQHPGVGLGQAPMGGASWLGPAGASIFGFGVAPTANVASASNPFKTPANGGNGASTNAAAPLAGNPGFPNVSNYGAFAGGAAGGAGTTVTNAGGNGGGGGGAGPRGAGTDGAAGPAGVASGAGNTGNTANNAAANTGAGGGGGSSGSCGSTGTTTGGNGGNGGSGYLEVTYVL